MTDLRARLSDALADALTDALRNGMALADHLADVLLLSLPGVAVVELPKRNRSNGWSIGSEDGRCVFFDDQGRLRTIGNTFVEDPRAFAAALLAAAVESATQ